jgi:shikimate kinase
MLVFGLDDRVLETGGGVIPQKQNLRVLAHAKFLILTKTGSHVINNEIFTFIDLAHSAKQLFW